MSDRRNEAFGGVVSREPIGSVFSPDGRWLAYTYSPGDDVAVSNRGIFVQPFPAPGAVFQAPRQLVDFHPVWTRDGKELVFLGSTTAGQMVAVSVHGTASLTFGSPSRFPARVSGDRLSADPRICDILPDGRFIGVINSTRTGQVGLTRQLRVVLNWTEELAQRLETK